MINTINLPPFKKMCVTIGNLPSSFMESMTYYEALCWLYDYFENTLLPAVNTNSEAITELQNAFTTLQTYVNTYFDNLDVQTEINNKLDDMAEGGELTDIIAQYLGLAGVLAYNTVADMKLAENLANGSTAKTLGYHTLNDGGSATYKIRTITNDDIVDEHSIIALYDNTLIAELITDSSINPVMYGAYNDNIHDDGAVFESLLNYASNKGIAINLIKTLYINQDVVLNNGLNLVINGSKAQVNTLIQEETDTFANIRFGDDGYIEINNVSNITFNNIGFNGTKKAIIIKGFRNRVYNCGFNGFENAISVEAGTHWNGENQIINCAFNSCTHCIVLNNGSDGDINGCLADSTCTTFITGGYDAGYKIENNHDYSTTGSVLNGYNMTFIGNYIDGWNKLTINANSGFNITGNTFIGTAPESGSHYAIKFTAQSISSGAVTDNIMATTNNNAVNDYLYFINITDVTYFAYVTVANNNVKICKNVFMGATVTKLYNTSITGEIKARLDVVNNKATLDTYTSTMDNGMFIGYAKFNLNSLSSSEVARWGNMFTYYIHFIKMNNYDLVTLVSDSRSIVAQGSYAQATSMEVWTIGLQSKPQIPNLFN